MDTTGIPQWTLAERLRKALSWASMSDEQIAAVLGVSDRTIRNYTTGATTPKLGMVRQWAAATRVPLEWLEGPDSTSDQGNRMNPCIPEMAA